MRYGAGMVSEAAVTYDIDMVVQIARGRMRITKTFNQGSNSLELSWSVSVTYSWTPRITDWLMRCSPYLPAIVTAYGTLGVCML